MSEEGICLVLGVLRLAVELIGGEEPAVGQARAAVRDVDNAADFRIKTLADGGQEMFQGGIKGGFRRVGASAAHFQQVGQIGFDQGMQFFRQDDQSSKIGFCSLSQKGGEIRRVLKTVL
ncbi:MAG: hypothetical protein M0042_01210 [Nitrospiraceae bacterium]|nr:hypothetical protein [Nitrospiraceae bacterium]